jgi:DNA-binding transcriptional regulator YiaG
MSFEDIASKSDIQALRELIQQVKVQESEEIFTPEEAARYCKVTTKTLENWRNGRTQKKPS